MQFNLTFYWLKNLILFKWILKEVVLNRYSDSKNK